MTSSAGPAVTIAIAAYNCAATVSATLDSCLAQTCPDVEVLVIDDGSTDATPEVLARYGSRIRVVRQANGGLARARNTGMREARGRFIAWMDADDLCHPDRLLAQAAVLETYPEVVLVSTNFSAFRQPDHDEDLLHLTAYYAAPQRLGGLERIYPQRLEVQVPGAKSGPEFSVRLGRVQEPLLEGNFVHPPTVMFRRSALPSAGECDPGLRYSSDYEFFLRLSRLGSFALLEAPLLRYRLSESQMSRAAVGGTMQLETIAIMDRLREADPAAYAKRRPLFEQRYARSYISAAAAIGTSDRRKSMGLLWRGLRYRPSPAETLRALLRIVVPPRLLQLRRSLASTSTPASPLA
jgi:glycosyltransferase involved in cell wall biosynthesis